MATPLSVAQSHLGYVGNGAPFWAVIDPSLTGDDWCGCFASYCFQAAGKPLPKMYESVSSGFVYCPDAETWAKANGRWTQDPQPGDVVLYCWDGTGKAEHTGIVESIGSDGAITATEGNTGTPAGVRRQVRVRTLCLGFIRPPGEPMTTVRKGADSAYGPSAATVRAAITAGLSFWGWYIGGPGAMHPWTDAEVAVLSALPYSLPIWVPALDLSGDPSVDYFTARTRVRSLGWLGPLALDTEASMRGNARLVGYVNGWCAAAFSYGDPEVVYGGGDYVPSTAHAWWIVSSSTPPAGECYQNGSGTIGGTSVDWDYADSAFPLATRTPPPAPAPPGPTYIQFKEGTMAQVPISTSSENGSGYADCAGSPGAVIGFSVQGFNPAPVADGGQGKFFEYGSVTTASVPGEPSTTRVCLSSSNVLGGTVTVNVTFGTPAS